MLRFKIPNMAFWKTSFRQQAVCKALQPKKNSPNLSAVISHPWRPCFAPRIRLLATQNPPSTCFHVFLEIIFWAMCVCLWKYPLLHLPWPSGCKGLEQRDGSITFLTGKVNPCHFDYLTLQLELCVRLCSDLGSLIWPSGKPLSDNRLCVRHFSQNNLHQTS